MTDFPYPSHLIGTRGARWFYEHLVEVTALRPAEAFGFLRELADWQDKTGVDVDKALAPLRMPVASLKCADDLAPFNDALGEDVRYKLIWAIFNCETVRFHSGSTLELAIYAGRFDRLFSQRHR